MTVAPWLTPALVVGQLPGVELDGGGALPADVETHRAAAGDYVERQRRDLFVDVGGVPTFTPPASVLLGAVMIVARLAARKGSPQGLASFGEFGPAAVLRLDPDIERMCGIGRSAKPVAK